MDHIVVVGNGVAGLTAADTLRRLGFEGELTVVGDESRPTYSRPALSKAALDPAQELAVNYLPEATHSGTELLGRSAVALDVDDELVTLDDDTQLRYDGLVIATGTHSRRFTNSDREFSVRSVEDASALRQQLRRRLSVTVVGGGPLGMEIASGAISMGCEVTLVHRGTPMAQHIGPVLASIFHDVAKEHGLKLVDDAVTSITELADGMSVQLSSERSITSDIVISAIGDTPNSQWLEDTGLLVDGCLVIDHHCRVRNNIVAAGDVAWLATPNGLRRSPLWTNAIEQAKTAAAALIKPEAVEPLNFQSYFWTDQWGMNLKISGPAPLTAEVPLVVKGSIQERVVVLHWPESGSAAALNIRMPIPRLHKLALTAVAKT